MSNKINTLMVKCLETGEVWNVRQLAHDLFYRQRIRRFQTKGRPFASAAKMAQALADNYGLAFCTTPVPLLPGMTLIRV